MEDRKIKLIRRAAATSTKRLKHSREVLFKELAVAKLNGEVERALPIQEALEVVLNQLEKRK